MGANALTSRIEDALERAGIPAVVEQEGSRIILSGRVYAVGDRQAAEDIARENAAGIQIDNQLEVEMDLPDQGTSYTSDEPSLAGLPDSVAEVEDFGADIEPDFTDQSLMTDPVAIVGPSSGHEDPVKEGDNTYFPPTDPVVSTDVHGQAVVLGGFATDATDDLVVPRSAEDRQYGDEAIADAVREELRRDAATTDLTVMVEVRRGVVHLRGRVPTIDDAENAEAVAARVPGVEEVREELEIQAL